MEELATGLQFPEGPIALADGSVIVCEIAAGRVSRVRPDGTVETVAETGGGPNGAAFGPDGRLYICNNGDVFTYVDLGGFVVPTSPPPDHWTGGSIQRVDVTTGEVETLYTESVATARDGTEHTVPLLAPNDLVVDAHGGIWFTDHGARRPRASDRTGVHYALPDGSSCREVLFPLDAPNGVGLSPAGDRLYVAETHTGRLWAWDVPEPGVAVGDNPAGAADGELLCGPPGMQLFDSLAVDSGGYICVGTLINGGITAVSPDGQHSEHIPLPDTLVTNLCFGGPDLRQAFVTLSGTGRLIRIDWPRPGLELHGKEPA